MHLSGTSVPPQESVPGAPASGRRRTLLVVAGIYLLISWIIWSKLWVGHPTTTTTCGCGDTPLVTWFIVWPAYAVAHGLDPFYSKVLFYPNGVNLLANASSLAFGVVLAPITWLFGPIAALNVALTLSPALSALAMFVLLRRWVSWSPAAFAGGLLYGFSPLALYQLTNAHLMIGMAAVPPLVVLCLDELLIRQRRSAVKTGVILGLLVTLQFFIGTEVLLMMAVTGLAGLVVVVGYAAWQHPDALKRNARYASVGLCAALVTAAILLAYPAWFALDGPSHFTGAIWQAFNLQSGGNTLSRLLVPESASSVRRGLGILPTALAPSAGGYPGLILSDQYFGFGIAAVLLGGLVAWRRDRRLWFFGAVALGSVLLSMGAPKGSLLPWQLFAHLPLFEDVSPGRFVLIAYLAVSVMVGLIVDHTKGAVDRRHATIRETSSDRGVGDIWGHVPRWFGAVAGVIVIVVALVPPALYLGQNIPIATETMVVPTWFRTVAPHLGNHQVLLVLPAAFSGMQPAMTWQATERMPYSMVGGGGPGATFSQHPVQRNGAVIIDKASFSIGIGTPTSDAGIDSVPTGPGRMGRHDGGHS